MHYLKHKSRLNTCHINLSLTGWNSNRPYAAYSTLLSLIHFRHRHDGFGTWCRNFEWSINWATHKTLHVSVCCRNIRHLHHRLQPTVKSNAFIHNKKMICTLKIFNQIPSSYFQLCIQYMCIQYCVVKDMNGSTLTSSVNIKSRHLQICVF